jgi:hypothetical protein
LERALPLAAPAAIGAMRGDRDASIRATAEADLLCSLSGDHWAAAFIYPSAAANAVWQGDLDEAEAHLARWINLVCDTALVYGYGEEQATIGARLIEQVIADKERSLSPLGVQEEVADDAGDDSDPPPMQPSPRKAPRLSTIERAAIRLRKT